MAKKMIKRGIKRVAKRKALRKRANRRATYNVPEMASCTVNQSATFVNSGQMYSVLDTKLAQFNRAAVVASQYQLFRITGITLIIKPSMDSFTSVAAGQPQKPYLYYFIDKAGNLPTNPTLENLKTLGCVAHRLDEKPFKITWRPAVSYGVLDFGVGSVYQQYKTSPWLNTNGNSTSSLGWVPSEVSHRGLYYFIEQVGAVTDFNVDVAVQFQFKKPNMIVLSSAPPATPLTLAIQDASPDGRADTNDISGNMVIH